MDIVRCKYFMFIYAVRRDSVAFDNRYFCDCIVKTDEVILKCCFDKFSMQIE